MPQSVHAPELDRWVQGWTRAVHGALGLSLVVLVTLIVRVFGA